MSGDDPYTYPGSNVLRNRLDIRDANRLDVVERALVAQRIAEGAPRGDFDLAHLRAIHTRLFQDLYAWAGEVRKVEIAKEGHPFQFRKYIETGMADIHRRLVRGDFLRGLTSIEFAASAGQIIGDVNYVHPFREGNGRTQLQYLKQLGDRAGHALDLTRLDPMGWMDGSRASFQGDCSGVIRQIERALA